MLPWKAKCFNHTPACGNRVVKATRPDNFTKARCQVFGYLQALEGTWKWLDLAWGLAAAAARGRCQGCGGVWWSIVLKISREGTWLLMQFYLLWGLRSFWL